jgi:hypothetical protein
MKRSPCSGPNSKRSDARSFGNDVALAQRRQEGSVHAHDWMTIPAGVAVAAHSGRPLVVQVHSTEFDRGGEPVNQYEYDIERQGMHAAAREHDIYHRVLNVA